jgi:threonine aldolase
MLEHIIDLRSDTVTKPSEGMRKAMMAAEVGDDVYGEDPTINLLEETAAEITGKEEALFVPSGSMANLIAQLCYVRKGDEVIIGAGSHCYRYEVGAGAAFAGSQYAIIEGNGLFRAEQAKERIRPRTFQTPATALVWIENTHNFGGGIIFPLRDIIEIKKLCEENKILLHMDGARVFNASAATDKSVKEIAMHVDSLSFCFSKGLGAPVGSILCLSKAVREDALRWRKMLGGGMRQAGILAAAALYALKNNVQRLHEDHENAKILARNLQGYYGIKINMASVQTNIVMAEVMKGHASALVQRLKEKEVLINAVSPDRVRFVTHLDVSREDILRASEITTKTAKELWGSNV